MFNGNNKLLFVNNDIVDMLKKKCPYLLEILSEVLMD